MSLFRRARPDDRLLELLENAGANVHRASTMLREMLADFPERSDLAREILLCEQEGDRIAHDIIHRLNQRGVHVAFDSRDLYALVSALDDIVDYAEQTADSLGLYAIEAQMEQAEALAGVLEAAAAAVHAALVALRQRQALNGDLIQIHQLENDGDRLSRDAIASLFVSGVDPMMVIRWKDIFESLEQGIDSCETVAHVLEGIALKEGSG
ncbi:MAG: DUF47 family protein [Thermoleophilaceae bacterium]